MSSRQRIILLLVAAVVLVGGIALAASSSDDSSDGGNTQASAPEATGTGDETGGTEAKDKPEAAAVTTIRIKGTKPVGGVKTLKYENGDTIALRFVADQPLEVHIHGFDRELALKAGEPVVTRFKANLEGIFEVEEHETEELVAKLEVRPK